MKKETRKTSLKKRKKLARRNRRGVGALYISRNQSLRKLQLNLKEFRKLCILKGIYPQEPSKKLKKKNKTFYYTKDIKFLLHDSLIPIFREFKIWRRRLVKAKAKKNMEKVEILRKCKPKYRLDHLIRERYPTFVDSIKDLDDCLCLLNLFACLPQTKLIKSSRVANCAQLCREFQHYVLLTRSLTKSFISIKGIYYQAVIEGQTVTWLVPHQFTPKIPKDVDITVMLTFLEFYETLMGFVNFRLFQSIGLRYPPSVDLTKMKDADYMNAIQFELERGADDDMDETEKATQDEMKEVFPEYSQAIANTVKADKEFKNLFTGLKFFISREVPREPLEFIIRSFGGAVSFEGAQGSYPETDAAITHQITDRPAGKKSYTREYLQPQWVFDCVNNRILLPAQEYYVNAKLPPHLSPFVNDEKIGYVPERRQKIDEMISIAKGIYPIKKKETKDDQGDVMDEVDSDDETEATKLVENRYAKELELESKGQAYTSAARVEDEEAKASLIAKREKKKKAEKHEHHHFREIMIPSHRKRNLYIKDIFSKKRKYSHIKDLIQKRAKLDENKK